MLRYLCLFAGGLLLSGCLSSGPEQPLRQMATALTKKDAALFLAQMDLPRCAQAQLENMTQGDAALRALDSMGKQLGLGGMDQLLGSVINVEARMKEDFQRGVSTGELELQCRASTAPDCPWVAQSLQNAQIKELRPDAAIARVTTPANLSSWLALRKEQDVWKVVGQAVMERQATTYALQAPAATPQQRTPAKPAGETPQPSTNI